MSCLNARSLVDMAHLFGLTYRECMVSISHNTVQSFFSHIVYKNKKLKRYDSRKFTQCEL